MTDMEYTHQKRLLEAAFLMSAEPMRLEELSKLTGIHSLGYLKKILVDMKEDYLERGFHLIESPEGWIFQVDSKYLKKVANLTPYQDMAEGEKRCLALVAYKEPIMQSEVVNMQGNKCYTYIKRLAKKGLIKTERHGRSKIISLTTEFERYFGGNKQEIRDKLLKQIKKFEEREEQKELALDNAKSTGNAEELEERKVTDNTEVASEEVEQPSAGVEQKPKETSE